MRRSSRKYVINFVLFITALLAVLYLNGPESHPGIYAWTTVRYRTTASVLPQSHGKCPGLLSTSQPVLVVSRVDADGNSKWLRTLSDKYHLCVYEVDAKTNDDSEHLRVPANRGHEAMAYLTFIIDNYDTIPHSGAVFVHGSRWAWHNDHPEYDNAALLSLLNVSSALEPIGYHNLRCDWSASTCLESYAPPQGSLETTVEAFVDPYNARAVSDAALPRALHSIFGAGEQNAREKLRLGRSHAIRSQCCAQFAVSRRNIQMHSRNEYVALRQWLLDGTSGSSTSGSNKGAPADDRVAGRILSYVWHILFASGQDDVGGMSDDRRVLDLRQLNRHACPSAADCYCRLYGLCELKSCNAGRCVGQYELPPDFALPSDWAKTHS